MAAAGAYFPAAPSHLVLAKRYCELHPGPPGGDFCLLGLVRGQEQGVPREVLVCLWVVVVSFLLVGILGAWLVVLKCPPFFLRT